LNSESTRLPTSTAATLKAIAAVVAVSAFLPLSVAANTLNTGGLSGVNNTYTAYSIGQGSFEFGLSLKGEYGDQALDQHLPDGSTIVRDVLLYGQDIYLALGLTNWMDVAVDLPFYQDQIHGFGDDAIGLGDLSASLKLMHPGMKSDALIRLAYIMRASFPTGNADRGYYQRDPQFAHVSEINTEGAFTSRGYSLNPMLAWTFDMTRLKSPAPWLVHVNFGMDALFYTEKNNIPEENTAMKGGLAVEWMAKPDWSVFMDFYGKSRLVNITKGPFLEIFAKDQLTLALGTRNVFASGLSASFVVEGALSTQENHTQWNVNHGGNSDGARRYGIQPTPILGATLTLGFGQTGRNADSDFDGNPNAVDKCIHDGEDYDGYEDEDGCPDLVHVIAAAPVQIRDTVVITQLDTIVRNDTIRVPMADTLKYRSTQDPNAIFGFGKTTFPAIQFKIGSDELSRTSFKTLNDIAQSMKNFPEVSLQVLGYTDRTGSDATNKALSEKRAQSVVDYLVKQGLTPNRLQPLGMGSDDPVSSNTTPAGRLLNRRVEFKRIK
jgi:outer membrane protein OmpA-like peptidoglycan-associated protein